jgi:quercetin dioxygenase-like cupin family protein
MSEHPTVTVADGVTRQILSETPDMMVVAVHFERAGLEGTPHSHPHLQSIYVESGRFRFTLGEDAPRDLGAGEAIIIPSNLTHGSVCIEAGTLIDCFSPRRDDFL